MLLELKNIEAAYGNIKALKGINLAVPEGKIVTLIGANGAGKSTTMKTIMAVMTSSSRANPSQGRRPMISSTAASSSSQRGVRSFRA